MFAAAACCSPHYPYKHNPGAADPSSVSVEVQEMQLRGAQIEERKVDVKKKSLPIVQKRQEGHLREGERYRYISKETK